MKLGFYHKNKFYLTIPKYIEGLGVGLRSLTNNQLIELGAKEIIEPKLNTQQRKGDPYYNKEDNTIRFYIIDFSKDEVLQVKKNERNQKLKDGIIVSDIWFNEEKLTQFTVMSQMCKESGIEFFEWGKETGWAVITVEEALAIAVNASSEFSKIYKDYQ